MGDCRNCGSEDTKSLGYIGQIAPFALKRVLGLEYGYAPSRRALKRIARSFSFGANVADKLYGKSVLTEMEACLRCSFLQMRNPFSDAALARFYEDYRSESYNRERIQYEPRYALIAADVGQSVQEIETRTTLLTRWLASRIHVDSGFCMLDYGGADGKLLPRLPATKHVFDISNVQPVTGVTRVNNEAELGTYSYVQLTHVLEHVACPANLTKKAAQHVANSGYLYIEVPQELTDAELARLVQGNKTIPVAIHEHINYYSQNSVRELLKGAGLCIESIESEVTDLGWIKATIIRALARPNRNRVEA